MRIEIKGAGSSERIIRRCVARLKYILPDWVEVIYFNVTKLRDGVPASCTHKG